MNNHLLPILHICTNYQAAPDFIHSLHECGLIEIITIDKTDYLEQEYIRDVERMIHLHYDLEINIEGIDVINQLLSKLENMDQQINQLKHRLSNYEGSL